MIKFVTSFVIKNYSKDYYYYVPNDMKERVINQGWSKEKSEADYHDFAIID